MATEAGLPNFWSMTNDGWWMINDGWSTINDQWWTDVCHRTGSGDRRCRITNTAWQYSTTSVKSNHILMEHILIQHGQVAALSRRGGQHKPICVSHLVMCRLGLEALDRPSRAQALKAVTKALEGPGPGLQICQALGQGFRPCSLACIHGIITPIFSVFWGAI